MGRYQGKIERIFIRGLIGLVVFILLLPFNLIAWLFSYFFSNSYTNSNGYVVLKKSGELEHRFIAKQTVGRDLYRYEVVHHINGNKTDNSLRNLCLMDGEKHEHFHAWLRWKKEKSGRYPRFSKQKQILRDEYGGTLLEYVVGTCREEMHVEEFNSKTPVRGIVVSSEELFSELSSQRLSIAKEQKIPAYLIFHDSTLKEMAEEMPVSESEMLRVKGVGPKKFKKYGHIFLKTILDFRKSSGDESA